MEILLKVLSHFAPAVTSNIPNLSSNRTPGLVANLHTAQPTYCTAFW